MWSYHYVHSADAELLKRIDRALHIADRFVTAIEAAPGIAERVVDDLDSIAHNFATLVEFVITPPPEPPQAVGIVAEPSGQPTTH